MDRIQLDGRHIDGWLQNYSFEATRGQTIRFNFSLELVNDEVVNFFDRIRIIFHEHLQPSFQGIIEDYNVTFVMDTARVHTIFDGPIYQSTGLSRRTLNVTMSGVVGEYEAGYEQNFINTNYEEYLSVEARRQQVGMPIRGRFQNINTTLEELVAKVESDNKLNTNRNRLEEIEDF